MAMKLAMAGRAAPFLWVGIILLSSGSIGKSKLEKKVEKMEKNGETWFETAEFQRPMEGH